MKLKNGFHLDYVSMLFKYVFLITLKIEDGSFRFSAASPSIHPIPSPQDVEMPTIRMTERCGDRSIHVAPSIAVGAIRAPSIPFGKLI